ncbi:hypothetical protein VPH35_137899 [Triticum aestivum]
MPLYLPRRLTIPGIAAHRWSRPSAVAFAALAPVLLATTWNSHNTAKSSSRHAATTTVTTTRSSSPAASLASSSRPSPRPQRTPRPLPTGARVLSLAMAVSSCCAGPLFNTVVGLRLSLTLAAGAQYLAPFTLPADAAVYETVGLLCTRLAWVLVVVKARGMRLDRVHGVGLIVIYVRVLDSLGLWFE